MLCYLLLMATSAPLQFINLPVIIWGIIADAFIHRPYLTATQCKNTLQKKNKKTIYVFVIPLPISGIHKVGLWFVSTWSFSINFNFKCSWLKAAIVIIFGLFGYQNYHFRIVTESFAQWVLFIFSVSEVLSFGHTSEILLNILSGVI